MMNVAPLGIRRIRRVLLLGGGLILLGGVSLAQTDTVDHRTAIRSAIAAFVGVNQQSVEVRETYPARSVETERLVGFSCEADIKRVDGTLLGRLHAGVTIAPYRVAHANWSPLTDEEIQRAAMEFVSSHFRGWSENMVGRVADPHRSGSDSAEFPVSWFRWDEKVGRAWTGTWVAVKVPDATPGLPLHYLDYVAQPRTIEDVEVSEERAIEVAIEEAERRGLEDLQVKQVHLYLDHQVRHFPHYIVAVAEPEPRGKWGVHPLQISVIVHGVTGEVVPASTGHSGGEEDGTAPAADGAFHDADAGRGDVDARERGGEGHR